MKKVFVYLLWFLSILLLLGSCGTNKNNEVNNTNNNNIVENQENKKEAKQNFTLEEFNKDIKKISFIELNNSLYSNWGGDNLFEKIKILSWTDETKENKLKASFLESFIWDYENALKNREDLCKNNKKIDFCKKIDLKLISYRPVDTDWNKLDNVNISIDNKKMWVLKWKNNLNIENKFIHRIKVSKEWYLPFYKKIFIDTNWNQKESLNPKLLKASIIKTIKSNEDVSINSKNFSFHILKNSFKTKDNKVYNWDVKINIFDISEDNWDLNVLNLDTFDSNWTYVWNSMVTFGMPLVIAYDKNWNQLNITSEIIWKWQIQNLEKAPWIDLDNVPKNIWLSKKELDKYKIPNFWHLDLDSWVWIESKMKILDSKWNYEFKLN